MQIWTIIANARTLSGNLSIFAVTAYFHSRTKGALRPQYFCGRDAPFLSAIREVEPLGEG